MMKKILNTLSLLILVHFISNAQPLETAYRSPLDRAISLSANFAEIRPNHFHSGLDLRVGGAPGAKLYAVAEGYVARIVVGPFGYGKAVYINHPTGETSVYGHLNGFSKKIRDFVEDIQYTKQSFRVDTVITNPEILPLNKGEIIGFAGNSGSSFGAHLHFEIRKTENQATTNTVKRGIIKVTDNVPPTIHNMGVFTLDSTYGIGTPRLLKSAKVIKKGNVWVPEDGELIEVYNPVYFGIDANDYQPENRSKFGVYQMKVFCDDSLFYAYTLDEFLFEETRYINSFIAYDELIKNKRSYVKTHIENGNKLGVYHNIKNKGLVVLNDSLTHKIRIELYDDNNNKTTLAFKIRKSKKSNPNNNNLLDSEKFRPVLWNKPFTYENEDIKINLAQESLYSDMLFTIDSSAMKKGYYSPVWNIGNPNIPLHKRMAISLRNNIPEHLKVKAIIVKLSDNNKISSMGGKWDNDSTYFISATVSDFGSYYVAIDTVAPTVKVNFKNGADLRQQKSLTVTIGDNLSGIASYNGYIDGEWALFDYDAKNRALTYTFDSKRIKKGIKHKLKVVVDDACANSTTFETEFTW